MTQDKQEDDPIDIDKLKSDLEELLGTAKSETEKINELSIGISTKAKEIELYYDTYKDTRSKFDDSETGIIALLNQATSLKNQIQQLSESAQVQGDQVTQKVVDLQTKIKEIEVYYGTFADLRLKLDDGQTGLQALLTQATGVKDAIGLLTVSAQAHLDQIAAGTTAITTKIQEIESYYTKSFTPLKAKVDDPKNGIQATFGIVTGLKNEIVKTKAGVDESFREIKNLNEQSEKLREHSEKSKNEIEELKKRSAEFKADIEQTFQIATDVSLANSFNERKKDLKVEADKWLKNVEYSTLLLVVIVLVIFASQYIGNTEVNSWRFWYRFIFTSPIVFYIAFASYNYTKVRDLLEKYAFKFASSLSLQSYTKLLTDNFKEEEHKDKLLAFTIRTIDMVYKEPYVEKDKTRKFSIGNKIINIGLEDVETLAKQDINIQDIVEGKEKSK